MKKSVLIESPEELADYAKDSILVYEDPPEGADPEVEDDPFLEDNGILGVEPTELEVHALFPAPEFPETLSFDMDFMGWDETYESQAAMRGLAAHCAAWVTLRLVETRQVTEEHSVGLYDIEVEHGY